jgi:hypothetical protein
VNVTIRKPLILVRINRNITLYSYDRRISARILTTSKLLETLDLGVFLHMESRCAGYMYDCCTRTVQYVRVLYAVKGIYTNMAVSREGLIWPLAAAVGQLLTAVGYS